MPSVLDDTAAVDRVLAFISVPEASLCCSIWAKYLYGSLQLQERIRFNRLVHSKGSISYHHNGCRSFGDDFEESVAFQFDFLANRTYNLQWSRSFGQWTAANERQIGGWVISGDRLCCNTVEGPEVPEGSVRYAPVGRSFELRIQDILGGNSQSDEQAPAWEYKVRGVPVPEHVWPSTEENMCEASGGYGDQATPAAQAHSAQVTTAVARPPPASEDSRFVEIDGDFHEVSADIRDMYPEEKWPQLMGLRLRFGLMGGMM